MTEIVTRPNQAKQAALTTEEMDRALTRLNDLFASWRVTDTGESLGQQMTQEERTSALSTLSLLASPASAVDVAKIVRRMLAMFPGKLDQRQDSVAEDWTRTLMGLPLASIWDVYNRSLKRRGQFAPSLGDFYNDVKDHADGIKTIRRSIMRGEPRS